MDMNTSRIIVVVQGDWTQNLVPSKSSDAPCLHMNGREVASTLGHHLSCTLQLTMPATPSKSPRSSQRDSQDKDKKKEVKKSAAAAGADLRGWVSARRSGCADMQFKPGASSGSKPAVKDEKPTAKGTGDEPIMIGRCHCLLPLTREMRATTMCPSRSLRE